VALSVGEERDAFGRGAERDPVASEAGADAQGDAEVSLPVPGGSKRTALSLPARKSSWPRWRTWILGIECWKAKSNSSSVLRAVKRAFDPRLAAVAMTRRSSATLTPRTT
jgi:hypothetical protein